MRWAKVRLSSEEGREVERRDSRESQEDRKPRPDQPPPTASKKRGRKRSPTLAHRAAVSWKRALHSTCWNTVPESQSALDQMKGQSALQMEKSQASGSPDGPCGTQISAGRGHGQKGRVGQHRRGRGVAGNPRFRPHELRHDGFWMYCSPSVRRLCRQKWARAPRLEVMADLANWR